MDDRHAAIVCSVGSVAPVQGPVWEEPDVEVHLRVFRSVGAGGRRVRGRSVFVNGPSYEELRQYLERAHIDSMAQREPGREEKEHPFIRKGKVDGWKEELSEESVGLIEDRYADLMEELGYFPLVRT